MAIERDAGAAEIADSGHHRIPAIPHGDALPPGMTLASVSWISVAVRGVGIAEADPALPPPSTSTSTSVVAFHSRVPSDSGVAVGMLKADTRACGNRRAVILNWAE